MLSEISYTKLISYKMPRNYVEQRLDISDNQKEKIRLAMKNEEPVTIKIKDNGDDIIALTETQINKINKAFEKGKGVNITISKALLKYNNKAEWGFLPLLMGLARAALPAIASKVLPAWGVGALSGLASTGVNKIFGNGLYLKKGGNVYKIKTSGKGLYLSQKQSPPKDLQKTGNGFYLRDYNNKFFDGSGIVHEITKNIPLLNLLL